MKGIALTYGDLKPFEAFGLRAAKQQAGGDPKLCLQLQ